METATSGQLTAPNLSVTAGDIRFAYRRFGAPAADGTPLVFLQHFRGNLDNWDPALVDAIAAGREVILFDNVGVGGTSGTTPRSVSEMAAGAIAFLDALRLRRVDLLGFSLGGYVAQEIALQRPHAVRRIVLAGTGPEGGFGMHGFTPEVHTNATQDEPSGDNLVFLFFSPTDSSSARGWEFVQRIFTRTEDRDAPTTLDTRDAQLDAIATWGIADASKLARLSNITHPTLVANGDNDVMVPTRNTHLLGGFLPKATVSVYPDAGHGFMFQYPDQFAAKVLGFLGSVA